MKKILILFTLCCLLLTGCFSKGVDLSSRARNIGMTILETVDSFLDEEITATTASNLIQGQCNQINTIMIPGDNQDQSLKFACDYVSFNILQIAEGEISDHTELIKARNQLAELMGKRQRR